MTGDELRERRMALGWTQRRLACRMKTPLSTYKKWELGISRIPGAAEKCLELIEKQYAPTIGG